MSLDCHRAPVWAIWVSFCRTGEIVKKIIVTLADLPRIWVLVRIEKVSSSCFIFFMADFKISHQSQQQIPDKTFSFFVKCPRVEEPDEETFVPSECEEQWPWPPLQQLPLLLLLLLPLILSLLLLLSCTAALQPSAAPAAASSTKLLYSSNALAARLNLKWSDSHITAHATCQLAGPVEFFRKMAPEKKTWGRDGILIQIGNAAQRGKRTNRA